jgi:hypothetical protein
LSGQLTDTSLIYTSFVNNGGGNADITEIINGNNDINIYPNPVKDAFVISVKNEINDNQNNYYSIHDITGKSIIVEKLNVINSDHVQKVETSNLPSGIYFVNVNINAKNSTFKIIKQ